MEDCLCELERQKESPLDLALVQLVRVQLTVERASTTIWHDTHLESNHAPKGAEMLYSQAMLVRLEEFGSTLSLDSHHDSKSQAMSAGLQQE